MRARRRGGLTALLCLLGFLSPATAESGEGVWFLPPQGCLPADGGPAYPIHLFQTTVPGSAKAPGKSKPKVVKVSSGKAGALESLGGGLYRFRYSPPALEKAARVTFSVGGRNVSSTLDLCPHGAGQIQVTAEPTKLLAGQGQKAFLRIRVLDPAGQPQAGLPLQVTTNVGMLEPVQDLGAGDYRVVFVPPDDPFPQVGILMVANPAGARLDRVAVGRVVIPITARLELPGKTARGTKMQMEIAGRQFGPVEADQRGQFKLPILVPPGYGKGKATSIDRVGNRRTRQVDLFLPETNQLGLWAYPDRLPADGQSRSRLLVTTFDRFGIPTDVGAGRRSPGVRIKTEHGRVSAVRHLGTGLYEAYYSAPAVVGPGGDRIEVTFPGGGSKSKASIRVALLPGPAAKLQFESPDLIAADGSSKGLLRLSVTDGRGNPVGGELVQMNADPGNIRSQKEPSPGLHTAELVVDPKPGRWDSEIQVSVEDRKGEVPAALRIAADGLVQDDRGRWVLTAAVVDNLGLPVPGQRVDLDADQGGLTESSDSFGRVRFPLPPQSGAGPQRVNLKAKGGQVLREAFWVQGSSGPRLLPVGLDASLPLAAPLSARAQVKLHPPVEARVSVFVGKVNPGVTSRQLEVRVTDAKGTPIPNRRVKVSASSGKLGVPKEVKPGSFQVEWTPGAAGWKRAVVSAVDLASHVGAVVSLEEGRTGS